MNKFLSILMAILAIAQVSAFMGTPVFTQRPVRGGTKISNCRCQLFHQQHGTEQRVGGEQEEKQQHLSGVPTCFFREVTMLG